MVSADERIVAVFRRPARAVRLLISGRSLVDLVPVTSTRLSRVALQFALVVAWAGRLLTIIFTVLCTVFAWYLTLWAWRLQPAGPGDTDAEYTAGIAMALGALGGAFSAMATAARALPSWWLGIALLPCAAAWVLWWCL